MSTEKPNWMLTGEEGFARKQSIDKVTKLQKEKGVIRFRLNADEKGKIIYLDSAPVYVYEHNIKINGRWGNYFTCVKEIAQQHCPLCDRDDKPVYTAYLSVIDTRQFTRKDGSISKNRKVLYPAKGATIKKIHGLIKKHGDLRGKMFEVTRYTPNEPNCGTDFDFEKEVDLTKIEDSSPHDYEKILAPPSEDEYELAGIPITKTVVVGSDEDIEKSEPDEVDPF